MGIKLLWTGLTILLVLTHYVSHADVVGGIFMGIGLVLMWLDR